MSCLFTKSTVSNHLDRKPFIFQVVSQTESVGLAAGGDGDVNTGVVTGIEREVVLSLTEDDVLTTVSDDGGDGVDG